MKYYIFDLDVQKYAYVFFVGILLLLAVMVLAAL